MSEKVELSIIIIALKKDYLYPCLDSLKLALKNISHEIIVIDNSVENKIDYKGVKIIKNTKKTGFGENNNLGLKIATGKYILLLNDDTKIIDKNIFSEMLTWIDTHPKVGVVSGALVNPDEKTFQRSGGYFPTLFRVLAWMLFIDDIPYITNLIKPYHPNLDYFKKEHQQDWVTGAFFLMRKKAFDEVGFFDKNFFLYVEEVDLSYRFWLKSWESWYLPKWKTVHYSKSTNGSENSIVMEMQNLKLFYKKHYSSWQLPVLTFILKLGCLIRIPIFGKTYVKAFRSI